MGTRIGRLSAPDKQGQYARQLGWKCSTNGKRIQHKFRLGRDRQVAEVRESLLRRIWGVIEQEHLSGEALWDDATLEIARQVASGADSISIAALDQHETAKSYRDRIQQLQNRYRFLRFEPQDTRLYKQGLSDMEFATEGIVLDDLSLRMAELRRKYEATDQFWHPVKPTLDTATVLQDYRPVETPATDVTDDGQTLHQAFDAYRDWIKEEYAQPNGDGLTDYGNTKLGQVQTLRERHDDEPLAHVGYSHIATMYRYWRQRPVSQSTATAGKQMSKYSIRHYLGELERFFKWLHLSSDFAWKKPEGFEDLDKRVQVDADEIKASIRQVSTFQLDELRTLNRYATPAERLYLMLALNCGFGAKEIATLTIGECYLNQGLPADEQELFNFPTTHEQSFVSLVRNKTTIVGKYLLFAQTATMLQWAMQRRLEQPNPASDQPLLLTSEGNPLDKPSEAGNPSRQIPNSFQRLKKRCAENGEPVANLPFKCLRKTSGDLIRRYSDGEVSGVFLLHGSPVRQDMLSDVYTNRPFGKVYRAIQKVEEYLQPVFEETSTPTEKQSKADTPIPVIEKIAKLHRRGATVREIEAEVSLSRSTIHRHIKNLST